MSDPAAQAVPLVATFPFGALLLAIAALPLVAHHWWENNRNKAIVALLFGLPVGVWAYFTLPEILFHTLIEYVSFLLLLGSLFVISGGIFLDGDLRATPRVNATFLAIGALLANLIGTTGASMVLIRPLLRTNSERKHVTHTVIFFIFVVCNTGGCLTPLGDPPLFVGYLKGVPFTWTLRLWPDWLLVNCVLVGLYWLIDSRMVKRETPAALAADRTHFEPLRLHGRLNLVLLVGIVAAVAFLPLGWREGAMLGLALLSLKFTAREIHEKNAFGWGPIVEVAVLFIGIFLAMIPALEYLRQHGPELGVQSPKQFFWFTGLLSGFLDNTPTYLTFLSLAQGLDLPREVAGVSHEVLVGISLGAVYMGALTYIGNGPNFMVKAIADARGTKMPGFFGYMAWSLTILLPIFWLTSTLLL